MPDEWLRVVTSVESPGARCFFPIGIRLQIYQDWETSKDG